ncbi:hypothetical protein MNB_SM-4-1223 [hydrothermal vent metagenome]|uniref:Uncharacterized protein n=1 Tax=hydrothermal vent metagenome TaxID=652676 RepID=A0A1W1CLT7_9ZZZZ
MEIHGIRPELQPEAVLKKAREANEVNKQADNPVRGHDDVVPPVKKESIDPNRLLDVKG